MARKKADDDKPAQAMTPNQFLEHLGKIRRAKVLLDEATSAFRLARKAAKDAGMPMKAFATIEQIDRMDDDEAEVFMRAVFRLGDWAGMPFAKQIEMFKPGDDQKPTKKAQTEFTAEQAKLAGYAAGKRGDPMEPPYAPGELFHVKWAEGWHDGQAAIATELGPDTKQASTERKRRARAAAAVDPIAASIQKAQEHLAGAAPH